jgi:hypothetical protein
MKVLVACEFSGRVREAFWARGLKAFSCDIIPSEKPIHHIQADVLDILDYRWDMMLAFPPCTDLASSGARWFKYKQAEQEAALEFIQKLMDAPIPRIAIENPIGVISTRIRKPDQIIHPWMFGDDDSKGTCLLLKNLPLLVPTHDTPQALGSVLNVPERKDRWKDRSRTYPGIARAMADQWGRALIENDPPIYTQLYLPGLDAS